MSSDAEALLEPFAGETSNKRQRLFMRYFTAILIDLTVLNLFAEYWDRLKSDPSRYRWSRPCCCRCCSD